MAIPRAMRAIRARYITGIVSDPHAPPALPCYERPACRRAIAARDGWLRERATPGGERRATIRLWDRARPLATQAGRPATEENCDGTVSARRGASGDHRSQPDGDRWLRV